MIKYGKSTQSAIAAMSRLAEVYDQDLRLSSHDIAKARNLPQPHVAKLLTMLSQFGLVNGAPGPRGGYALAHKPDQISLFDVVAVFERTEDQITCPFGPGWCGNREPCPLHDKLIDLSQQLETFLRHTTLAVFTAKSRSTTVLDSGHN